MKKACYILIIFVLYSVSSFAQWKTDTLESKENFAFHTSASFGKDWWNNSYFMTEYGFDYKKYLTHRLSLRAGFDIYDLHTNQKLRDLAPRRNDVNAMVYVGADYIVSDRLEISGTLMFDSWNSTIGADVDVLYKFSENSFLNVSATFIQGLQFSGHHKPVPYWND
ncbi:MAG: hypothetical protein IJ213_06780 [Bacteroidales bacterium]|nr:hypothetical protein [Bacteroidales bacterium]